MGSKSQTLPVVAALKWMIAVLIVAFPPLDIFFSPLAQLFPVVETMTHHNLFWGIVFIVIYEICLLCIYIFTQFWQQLAPGWFKELSTPLDLFVHTIFSGYRRRYCWHFSTFHRDLDVRGTGTIGEFSLEVEQVFVELRFDPTAPHRASASPVIDSSHLYTGNHEIWEYLATRENCLVVLGAPGSGKTTLLMHLGLLLARGRSPKGRGFRRGVIPLLLFLRDHSNALTDEYTLVDAVMKQTRSWQCNVPQSWFQHQLSLGRCLVLLDGLDEVADITQRQKMVTWVQMQMGAYGGNQFLITSRPHGYRSNPLNGVTVLEVQPFKHIQIKAFLHHWYLAIEIKSTRHKDAAVRLRAREQADDLFRRLWQKEALLDLAVNPLLLTMIATVHRYRGSLPGERIELYREICEVLLGKRQIARGLAQDLRTDQRQFVLQLLAYKMVAHKVRELPQADVESLIVSPLLSVSSSITPRDFLRNVENASGLLLEREHAVYGFAHLTFQEYLAAVHIREHGLEHQLGTLVTQSWWHETIRLYCAQASATTLIKSCLVQAPRSIEALTLALECEVEARDLDQRVRDQLYDLVDQGIESPDTDRRRVVGEALLARRLTSQRMHALNESVYIDTSLVTCIEYQLFLDEMRNQGRYFQPDHWITPTFSSGMGKQPVLGVRRDDAKAFCTWLTQRSAGFWHYRLPQYEEWHQAEKTLWKDISVDIGCWVEGEPLFLWLHGMPSRFLLDRWVTTVDHVVDHVRKLARSLARYFDRSHDRSIARDLGLDFSLAHDRALDLTRDHARDLALDLAFTHALDVASDLASTVARALVRDHRGPHAREVALAHVRDRILARILDLIRDRAFVHDFANVRARDLALDRAFDLYLLLFVFHERFANNFPVYEGILLVKERRER